MILLPCKKCDAKIKKGIFKCVHCRKILPNASKKDLAMYGLLAYLTLCTIPAIWPSSTPSHKIESIAPKNKIAEYAVIPWTEEQYPESFKKWDKSTIETINSGLKSAALKVAQNPDCDRVEIVEMSISRSEPPNKITYYVDCLNGKRLYVIP